jgi:hypothetical protein
MSDKFRPQETILRLATESGIAEEAEATEFLFWRRLAIYATAARMGVPAASRSDDLEDLVVSLRQAARLGDRLPDVPEQAPRGRLRAM